SAVEVRILRIGAHRQAARRARQHLALPGRDALLDPLPQQLETIDIARNRTWVDSVAVAVDRRGSAAQTVSGLRHYIEPRERVDRFAPHRVEDRLVIVELLAGCRNR